MPIYCRHVILFLFAASSLAITSQAHSAEPSNRIVGGFELEIQNAPATVALLARDRVETDGDLYEAHFCGGTLIDARWVLTAAHCLVYWSDEPVAADAVMVLVGSSDLRNPVSQPVSVTQVIVHEDFTDTGSGKDIALLRLEVDAIDEPVALDAFGLNLQDPALVAGWGALNSSGNGEPQRFPSKLRGAVVEATPGDICGERVPAYAGSTDDTNICAGVPQGGIDSCQGDSGGPLYRVSGDDQTIRAVSGITSWGIGCASADFPGVYTNVSSYIDWVFANTNSTTITTYDGPGETTEPQQPSQIPPLPEPPEPSQIPSLPEPEPEPEPLPLPLPEPSEPVTTVQPIESITPGSVISPINSPTSASGLNIIPMPFSSNAPQTLVSPQVAQETAIDNDSEFLGANSHFMLLLLGLLQVLRLTGRRQTAHSLLKLT